MLLSVWLIRFEPLTGNPPGSIQSQAGRACLGDEALVIANTPLHEAESLSPLNHLRFSPQFGVPLRPKEIDSQFAR